MSTTTKQSEAATNLSFEDDGPYAVEVQQFYRQRVPRDSCGKTISLDFTISYPHLNQQPVNDLVSPVVFFFSGYSLPRKWYNPYCRRLASWGYAVVQYGVRYSCLNDEQEIDLFLNIRNYVKDKLELKYHPVIDWDKTATAGHSRGGKLAILTHIRNQPIVKTTFMIDPVNGFFFFAVPGTRGYPDAAVEMKRVPTEVGIIGHSGTTCLHIVPPKYDYNHFLDEAVKPGSWFAKMCKADHISFCDVPGVLGCLLNGLNCMCNATDNQEVIQPTCAILTAWMENKIPTLPVQKAGVLKQLMTDLHIWLSEEKHNGIIEEKPGYII